MAKESVKARNIKRQWLVERYAAKRAKLKEAGDYMALDKLPKNASPVRVQEGQEDICVNLVSPELFFANGLPKVKYLVLLKLAGKMFYRS
jgi:hypothetical protein